LRLERRSDRNAALTRLKVFGVTFLVAGFHFDLLTRPGNPTFVDRQITLVASPRNHFNLLNRLVVLIERPVLLSGESEDDGKIAMEVDFQLSLLVRPQSHAITESAKYLPLRPGAKSGYGHAAISERFTCGGHTSSGFSRRGLLGPHSRQQPPTDAPPSQLVAGRPDKGQDSHLKDERSGIESRPAHQAF
jgi:hypothetical protein